MPTSARRPGTVTGGKLSSARARTSAPMARKGATMRATGRARSESSPSSVASMVDPARMPVSIRSVVPELPQSSVPDGVCQASMPGDSTR